MTPEDFQQNNEHGGYPMFVQPVRQPMKRWLVAMLVMMALCLAVIAVKSI